MKYYSTAEITDKMQAIFDAANAENYCMGWETQGKIKVIMNTPKLVKVKISCMYECPSPTFKLLTYISEFFDTKSINDDNRFAESGCETCDYGSSHGYTLTIR